MELNIMDILGLSDGSSSAPAVSGRADKGKSLIDFPNDYVVIDLETTGLSPRYDEIIEFAGIKVADGSVTDRFETLIKPRYPVSQFITELTGITNEMLADAPDIDAALPGIVDFIGDNIVVGHNVNFDVNFLYDFCTVCLGRPFTNSFVDNMRLSRKLFPELDHQRLVDVAARLGVSGAGYHRAMSDSEVTRQCFELMRAEAARQYPTMQDFQSQFDNRRYLAKYVQTDKTEFDPTHPLYGKVCVFTGTLEKMVRADAMQLVADCGGICGDKVTAKTNLLVLGNNDYCKSIKDGKSNKQKKAEELRLKGNDIEIIPESVFYELVAAE